MSISTPFAGFESDCKDTTISQTGKIFSLFNNFFHPRPSTPDPSLPTLKDGF